MSDVLSTTPHWASWIGMCFTPELHEKADCTETHWHINCEGRPSHRMWATTPEAASAALVEHYEVWPRCQPGDYQGALW